jgi:hypothetical protein
LTRPRARASFVVRSATEAEGPLSHRVGGALRLVLVLTLVAPAAAEAAPVLTSTAKVTDGRTVVVTGTVRGRAAKKLGPASRWRAVLEQRARSRWTVRARVKLTGRRRAFRARWTVPGSDAAVTVRVRIVSGKRLVRAGPARTLRLVKPVTDRNELGPGLNPGPIVVPEPKPDVTPPPAPTPTATPTPTPTATPTDPAADAPPLPSGEMSSMADSTAFLYTGPNPVQVGVEPGTIHAVRVAVVRGRVLDAQGAALPGVRVAVLDHPELGHTDSRADGRFDLAVNGGGPLTLTYARDGYLTAQRQLDVPWQDFAVAPDVRLLTLDARVTRVDAGAAGVQVAQSSPVTDADGTRRVTLLFDPDTHATMRMPDGSTRTLSALDVRATEFTAGAGGPDAMPATLPPASAYTYAAELSVDQAQEAGATRVDFDRPVAVYVENFLQFPVGTRVPAGYYDREGGAWVAGRDGRVIALLTGGGIDADGNAAPDSSGALATLGIDDAERARLAGLYPAGTALWRVPVDHFTPWDFNWPYRPPAGARAPSLRLGADPPRPSERCPRPACIVTPEDQTLGERVDVAGTPFSLDYRSDRVPGRGGAVQIPLTGATLPDAISRVDLEVAVAGRTFKHSFTPEPDLETSFIWDGKDGWGRPVTGARPATISVRYVYPAVYATSESDFTQSFGMLGDVPLSANPTRQELSLTQTATATLAPLDARAGRARRLDAVRAPRLRSRRAHALPRQR